MKCLNCGAYFQYQGCLCNTCFLKEVQYKLGTLQDHAEEENTFDHKRSFFDPFTLREENSAFDDDADPFTHEAAPERMSPGNAAHAEASSDAGFRVTAGEEDDIFGDTDVSDLFGQSTVSAAELQEPFSGTEEKLHQNEHRQVLENETSFGNEE